MIELLPIKDKEKIKEKFFNAGLTFNGFSGSVSAVSGQDEIGYSLFSLDKEKITVLYISPEDDLMLFDGILRSTLHVAAENFVLSAYFGDTLSIENLKKLGFIKDENKKTLDMDKLFKGCKCCENKD